MASAEVNDLKPVLVLGIRQCDETIAGPHFVLGSLLRVPDTGLNLGAIGTVIFRAEDNLGYLVRHALPGEPQLHLLAKVPPQFPRAPNQ